MKKLIAILLSIVSVLSVIKYFKNFADKGVEICVKIFFPESGGSPQLSDAWPVK